MLTSTFITNRSGADALFRELIGHPQSRSDIPLG